MNPPKTTFENFFNIPHLEQVLLWFLNNDNQISQIQTPLIKILFSEGYRSINLADNDPQILEDSFKQNNETVHIEIIERWLVIRIWLDLVSDIKNSGEDSKKLEELIVERIQRLSEISDKTLITSGSIVTKYGLPTELKLESDLDKIINKEDKEIFKQNYIADTLLASEMRILAWIYREIFNKDFHFKK